MPIIWISCKGSSSLCPHTIRLGCLVEMEMRFEPSHFHWPQQGTLASEESVCVEHWRQQWILDIEESVCVEHWRQQWILDIEESVCVEHWRQQAILAKRIFADKGSEKGLLGNKLLGKRWSKEEIVATRIFVESPSARFLTWRRESWFLTEDSRHSGDNSLSSPRRI